MLAMRDNLVADGPSGCRESELTQGVNALARLTKMSRTQASEHSHISSGMSFHFEKKTYLIVS